MGILEDRANLAGRIAVVMGGANGLGRGISNVLARSGLDIAVCDIDGAALDVTVDLLRDSGRRIVASVVDVRDAAALDGFWRTFDGTFDGLDVVVNVAGGVMYRPFLDTGPDDWENDLRLNFGYVLQNSQHAARRMKSAARGGSIINVTTIEAHRAAPGFSVYSGAKAALTNFSRSLAVELAPYGIRVNNVAPDQTPTPGLAKSATADYLAIPSYLAPEERTRIGVLRAQTAIPMGRMGRIEDIENCVLFLASDLSSYVTGTTIHPDGGALMSAGWFNWPGVGFRNRLPFTIAEKL